MRSIGHNPFSLKNFFPPFPRFFLNTFLGQTFQKKDFIFFPWFLGSQVHLLPRKLVRNVSPFCFLLSKGSLFTYKRGSLKPSSFFWKGLASKEPFGDTFLGEISERFLPRIIRGFKTSPPTGQFFSWGSSFSGFPEHGREQPCPLSRAEGVFCRVTKQRFFHTPERIEIRAHRF